MRKLHLSILALFCAAAASANRTVPDWVRPNSAKLPAMQTKENIP